MCVCFLIMDNYWFVVYSILPFKKKTVSKMAVKILQMVGEILGDFFSVLIRSLSICFLAHGNLTVTWFFGKLAL